MSATRQARRRVARSQAKAAGNVVYEARRVTIQIDVQEFDPATNKMLKQGPAEPEVLCESDFFPGLQDYITDYFKRRGVLKIRNFVVEQKAS